MFKNLLKKIWAFIKKNWLTILVMAGVVVLLVVGFQAISSLFNNDSSLEKKLEEVQARHVKELADLNKIATKQQEEQ